MHKMRTEIGVRVFSSKTVSMAVIQQSDKMKSFPWKGTDRYDLCRSKRETSQKLKSVVDKNNLAFRKK